VTEVFEVNRRERPFDVSPFPVKGRACPKTFYLVKTIVFDLSREMFVLALLDIIPDEGAVIFSF
jgi:hypothetical protein